MNKKYWELFYSNELPSSFAKFCIKYFSRLDNNKIIDVGCGNGRDSYYFGNSGFYVHGIDYAIEPYDNNMVSFRKIALSKLVKTPCIYDVVYSRFFLHSITTKEIVSLIDWTKDLFMAEFRDVSDKPRIYTNHKRNLVDGEWVKTLLLKKGFSIKYYKRGRGLAKYKNENPLIVRIIAER